MPRRQIEEALLLIAFAAGPVRAAEVPQLLADINTTPQVPLAPTLPSDFVAVGGRLLFSTVPNNGNDDEGILWQTDGTASGTQVLSSSLCPFPCQTIALLGTWHGLAILKVIAAGESSQGTRLWRSDGTSARTFPLTDPLWDNSEFEFEPLRILFSSSGNIFYFNGCRETEGCLPWRSDGTRAGTFPLAGPAGGISN